MNRKFQFVSLGLILALLFSLACNAYLMSLNKELNNRINTFIPAAMNMENEQQRLIQKEKEQQGKIAELSYYKDSITSAGLFKQNRNSQSQSIINNPQNLPQDPAVMTNSNPERSFEDLNKIKQ